MTLGSTLPEDGDKKHEGTKESSNQEKIQKNNQQNNEEKNTSSPKNSQQGDLQKTEEYNDNIMITKYLAEEYIPNIGFIKFWAGIGFIASSLLIFALLSNKLFEKGISKIFSNELFSLIFIITEGIVFLGVILIIIKFFKDE